MQQAECGAEVQGNVWLVLLSTFCTTVQRFGCVQQVLQPAAVPPPSSSVSSCESDIIDSYGNCVPATCETWFDGCNNCGVMLNGLLHCTKKFCMIRQEEKCTEYTSSSVLVSLWYVYERFCS